MIIKFLFVSFILAQFVLCQNQEAQCSFSELKINDKGQFFYDQQNDIAIVLQLKDKIVNIKLYLLQSSKELMLKQQINIQIHPLSKDKFIFIPQIQKIILPMYQSKNQNGTLQLISYSSNGLSQSIMQTNIFQIEGVEFEPINLTKINLLIIGYDQEGQEQIETILMNLEGQESASTIINLIDKKIINFLGQLQMNQNTFSGQFTNNKYNQIYLSYLIHPYIAHQKNLDNDKQIYGLFNILAIEIFFIEEQKSQSFENQDNNYGVNMNNTFTLDSKDRLQNKIICMILYYVIKQQYNLECFYNNQNLLKTLIIDPFSKIIADQVNNKIYIINQMRSYSEISEINIQKSLTTQQNVTKLNLEKQFKIYENYDKKIIKVMLLQNFLILLSSDNQSYYEYDIHSKLVNKRNFPFSLKQFDQQDQFSYYTTKNQSLNIMQLYNQQDQTLFLAIGSKQQLLDQNHYGMKIIALIPSCIFLGILLFTLLSYNRFKNNERKLKTQIASFNSVELTYYQFKLRYINRIEYMKQKGQQLFNRQSQLLNLMNKGVDIYIDQLDNNRNYLVKTMKMISFQNQDYIEDFIKTNLLLEKYEGVQQIKHYCIVPEQYALIITPVPIKTLQYQIEEQIECLQQFDDQTILKIAKDVIKTLSQIQKEMNLSHLDIKPSSILLSQDGKYKLTNFRPQQFHLAQNYMLILSQGSMAFMAPQVRFQIELQMSNINNDIENEENQSYEIDNKDFVENYQNDFLQYQQNEEEYHLYNKFKSDVFSFGLTLLFATQKLGIDGLNINKELLNQRLIKLQQLPNYSDLTKKLITQMLQWEEDERPTFEQLLQQLQNN